MSFPIAALRDDFTNNIQDPPWAASLVSGSATKAETGGQAALTLPSSTAGAHLATYTTSGTYDLTGDQFVWNIGTMVATGVAATAFFQLLQPDVSGQLFWRQVSNAITARTIVAGVDTQLFTATWSSTTYKYLRIREASGTIFWDSSSNGTSWTNRASVANPFAVTSLVVQFAASCGNVASPGALKLDDVNLILPAPSSTWRETTADWSISNRLRPITLASDGGKQGVLVTADSMDSSRVLSGNLRYYAGPLGSASGGFLALTEYASLALAQASAFPIPIDGRVDLPALVDARYMRLYHRSIDASAHTIYEYVPRRIVQSDDVEAESIRAINIAAHTITADQIATINLDATARITAGGGNVLLDNTGVSINVAASATYDMTKAASWRDFAANADSTAIQGWRSGTTNGLEIHAFADTRDGAIAIQAERVTGGSNPILLVDGNIGSNVSNISMSADRIDLDSAVQGTFITGATGLNVGTATGAGAGQISTSGSVAFGTTIASTVRLLLKGASTTSADYGIVCQNSTPGNTMYVRNDSVGFLNNTAWTYSSDITRKTNIRALGRDIAHLMQLKPIRFDYIDGPTDRAGFSAQDVQNVFPELIEVQPDGSLGMRTDELLPIMLHAFKRLVRLLVNKGVITAADIAGVEPEP